MNREQLTTELIQQKKENDERINEIERLKNAYRRFKVYAFYTAMVTIIAGTFIVTMADYQWSKERTQLENTTEAYKKTSARLQELEKEFKIISSSGSIVYVGKEDLLNDLMTHYPDVSTKTKIAILETIISEAEKYNMNPLILYSIAYTESTFRHWLEHAEAIVDIGNKKTKIKAVGLMGITWENHKDFLQDLQIAETRGDLFTPEVNIKAGAAILNKYMDMELKSGAKTKTESALLRYFGGNFPTYVNRINNKITEFTVKSYFK